MHNNDVIPTFDMLLEELERVIPELNAQISELTAEKKFDQAQTVLDKAKQVTAIQQKVRALREEWQALNSSVYEPPRLKPKPKPSPLTSQEAFRLPILEALVAFGGKARVQKVLIKLEELMGHQLSETDWQTLPSNKREIRWRKAAQWSRLQMVKDRLLADNSPYGVWEITPLGRQVLEESKKKA